MGLIGAAFGMGFIFGPAIGGILAPIAPELPGLVAAFLCGTNALLAVFLLPESLPGRGGAPAAAGKGPSLGGVTIGPDELPLSVPAPTPARRSRLGDLRLVLADPDFRRGLVLMLLFTTSFSIIHPTLPLFMAGRFALNETGVGWTMAFMGVFSAVMQGLLVRPLVGRMGESALIRRCSIPFVAGFGLLAVSTSVPFLLLSLALLAIGFGGTLPSLVSLLSRTAPGALQGESLGVGQSAGALGRILGPLAAGVTWDLLGGTPTYLLAAAIGGVAAAWSLRLRQPGSEVVRVGGAGGPRSGPSGRPVEGAGPA